MKQTAAKLIATIRTNEKVAYEANLLSEQLEKFWENLPEYVSKETNDQILLLANELRDIAGIEYRANERLFNEFKNLRE